MPSNKLLCVFKAGGIMQIESLNSLQDEVENILNEIDIDELDDDLTRQFIEHHVLTLSLKAHTYKEMILRNNLTNEEQLKFKKYLGIYTILEESVAGRLNTKTTAKLYNQILTFKSILDANVTE
ncbi:MAG: hypothetical protein ABJK64_00005 [Paraglaciecola sp.]|uniref:hypothetical protein n=1 Tax=Paraglaciecola sp. TaxID=1920173 RepID=UPI003297098A